MLCLRTDGDVALVAADTTGPLADLVDSDRSRGERLADRATRQAPEDPFQWTATPAMTTRSTLRLANPANLPGDARRDGGSTRRDAVADTPEHHDGSSRARLVDRSTTALRPHPVYLELCGPLAATRARRVGQQTGSIREPLLTTTDGTILDGHARWQVAIERAQPNVPCLELDVTEDEALQVIIQRHRAYEGLNDYGRIVLALRLEPYFREHCRRQQLARSNDLPSSNLTNDTRRDVRKDIAHVAGVSTGNVTKVKQILDSVILEVRERLLRGEVSIHRAWQWRTRPRKGQRDALWDHLHRGSLKKTIARLVRAHAEAGASVQSVDDLAPIVLGGLAKLDADDITVTVVDVPGRAVVVTRACYNELLEKNPR